MRCRRLLAPLSFFAVFTAQPAQAAFAERYYQLHYDYEVAAQCGLISAAVESAFRAKRRTADATSDLSPSGLKSIRLKAYVAAEREYDNRGLGGYKPWCRGEAAEGVRRILDASQD